MDSKSKSPVRLFEKIDLNAIAKGRNRKMPSQLSTSNKLFPSFSKLFSKTPQPLSLKDIVKNKTSKLINKLKDYKMPLK